MRRSLFKHPLAVLRHLIGPDEGLAMLQKEMADLLECATVTVQKVEIGKLPLSEKLAKRISDETGAQIAWLLDGDPKAPPLTITGVPYSKDWYENFRARKSYAGKPFGISVEAGTFAYAANDMGFVRFNDRSVIDELAMATYGLSCHVRIRAITESAHQRSADFQVVRYKLDRFLDQLTTEFGEDKTISGCDIREAALIGVEESKDCEKLLLKMANDIMAKAKQPTASKSPSRRRTRKA